MSRRVRTGMMLFGVSVLLIGLALSYAYRAVQQAPPFYVAALEMDPQVLEGASRDMESRVAALYSDAVQEPTWQAAFTETEVNGWLTVALGERYAEFLPETFADPRIAFGEDECQIGFQFHSDSFQAAVSVRIRLFVTDTDELALCIKSAKLGTLPLPLAKIVDPLTEWAQEQNLPLRWSTHEGNPVALITLHELLVTKDEYHQLEVIEIHPGELLLSGKTLKVDTNLANAPRSTRFRFEF